MRGRALRPWVISLLGACLAVLALAGFAGVARASGVTAYVTTGGYSFAPSAVIPIDTATNTPGSPIYVGVNPSAIAITSNGKTAYVANTFPPTGLTPITLSNSRARPLIPTTGGIALAITPNHKTAYVVDQGGGVIPIALATKTPGTPIPVGDDPLAVAITPDGKTAYVPAGDGTLTPIATATNTPGTPIPIKFGGGGASLKIAIAPDGRTAYVVTSGFPGEVTPLTIATGTFGAPIRVGSTAADPQGIAITPDGRTAYVTDTEDGTVTPITLATNKPGSPIPVGKDPVGVAITPDGTTAYVADFGDNAVTPIDIATNTAGAPIPVGMAPRAIAITPHGPRATSTSLTCSPSSVLVAQATTCTATVTDTGTGTAVVPTGIVSVGSDAAGTITGSPCILASAEAGAAASCQVTYEPALAGSGQHTLTATYNGDVEHRTSSAQVTVAVTVRPTTVVVRCSAVRTLVGDAETCATTLRDNGAGTPSAPTGKVTFSSSRAGAFGAKTCTVSASSCQVSYTPKAVGGGLHTITAAYGGDTTHGAGRGQTTVAVIGRPTTTTLSCEETTLKAGDSTQCTAVVTDVGPVPTITPARITRLLGGSLDGFGGNPCTLAGDGATATCQVTYTAIARAGPHTLTARYAGDPAHAASTRQTTITVT